MALPKYADIEVPLLLEIEKAGGQAKPKDLYPRVGAHFQQLTRAELDGDKWGNMVQWARESLCKKGELSRTPRGVWRITEKGRQRIDKGSEQLPPLPLPPSLSPSRVAQSIDKGSEQLPPQPTLLPAPPKRHEELKQMMVEIGKKLGYYTGTEEGPEFRHDVVWRTTPYKTPSRVIEICDGGSLPKDFASLNWANQNWDARGILIVTDGKDFEKATRQLSYHPRIIVVKAETVDRLHELIMTNVQFLKLIFGEQF